MSSAEDGSRGVSGGIDDTLALFSSSLPSMKRYVVNVVVTYIKILVPILGTGESRPLAPSASLAVRLIQEPESKDRPTYMMQESSSLP